MKKSKILDIYLIFSSLITILFGLVDIISFINCIITESTLYIGYLLGLSLITMGIIVICKIKKRKCLIISSSFYLLTGICLLIELGFNLQILQLFMFGIINIIIYIFNNNTK